MKLPVLQWKISKANFSSGISCRRSWNFKTS